MDTGPATGAPELDPRIERSRRLVMEATAEVLGDKGYGGLTVEAVAAVSGVAKSTIYRHWKGKAELVEAAMRELKPGLTVATEGSVRDRVKGLLLEVARAVTTSTWSACLPALIDAAERDPEARALHIRTALERRQLLVQLLREGVVAGELPADTNTELLSEALVGPIFMRRLFVREAFAEDEAEALVALAFGRD